MPLTHCIQVLFCGGVVRVIRFLNIKTIAVIGISSHIGDQSHHDLTGSALAPPYHSTPRSRAVKYAFPPPVWREERPRQCRSTYLKSHPCSCFNITIVPNSPVPLTTKGSTSFSPFGMFLPFIQHPSRLLKRGSAQFQHQDERQARGRSRVSDIFVFMLPLQSFPQLVFGPTRLLLVR